MHQKLTRKRRPNSTPTRTGANMMACGDLTAVTVKGLSNGHLVQATPASSETIRDMAKVRLCTPTEPSTQVSGEMIKETVKDTLNGSTGQCTKVTSETTVCMGSERSPGPQELHLRASGV